MYYMKIEIGDLLIGRQHAKRASINYKIWLDLFIKVCGDRKLSVHNKWYVKYNKWLETRYAPCSVQYATIVLKNFFMYYKMLDIPCISPIFFDYQESESQNHSRYGKWIRKNNCTIPRDDFRSNRDSLMIQLLWDTELVLQNCVI